MGKKGLITKPIILREGGYDKKKLEVLKKKYNIWKEVDIYENQLQELFEISNPSLDLKSNVCKKKLSEFINKRIKSSKKVRGNWIYFPWSGNLVHTVNEEEYLALRTNRNRNLITKHEQRELYNSCIGILGLSVGSGLAIGLSYQGIAKNLKLAEFDNLETTNLNRVQAGIYQIGMSKLDIALQKIYEIDPYTNIVSFKKGLTKKVLRDFIYKNPKPDVIFEIIDDFEMKVLVRIEARKARIPVVTFANLGDNILVDIDRYDLDYKLPLFNGLLGNLPEEILYKPDENKNKYAVKMVGIENIPKRAMDSVKQIGKTLIGRPQLSSTVSISAALGSYTSRQIILGLKLNSGRFLVKLNKLLE